MREKVEFQGGAGRLAGDLYVPEAVPPFPTVLLCHGLTSCKENYADIAHLLQQEGFGALAYDCRGHGESGGALDGEAWRDVGKALEYCRQHPHVDAQRIGLLGSSLGAHNGLRAAADYPLLRTVVAFCTAPGQLLKMGLLNPDYWHLIEASGGRVRLSLPGYLTYLEGEDIWDLPARIQPRPILFVHARDDELIPCAVSERLYATAGEASRLLLLDSGGHRGPRHDPQVQRQVVDWLREKL
jgi:fermentation-respiration switch protein FrsA (DUF1100 family)